jgi:hypothetical protein
MVCVSLCVCVCACGWVLCPVPEEGLHHVTLDNTLLRSQADEVAIIYIAKEYLSRSALEYGMAMSLHHAEASKPTS